MTMQQALKLAQETGAFARPSHDQNYSYRYEVQRKQILIYVHGRDRFGVFQSGFWRTLTQKDIEDDWLICNQEGEPIDPSKPVGLTLKDLVA